MIFNIKNEILKKLWSEEKIDFLKYYTKLYTSISKKNKLDDDESHLDFMPYYNAISSFGEIIEISGKNYINLASNNYLALAENEDVKKSSIEAIKQYGNSFCSTPIGGAYSVLHKEVEENLADFTFNKSCTLLPSAYQLNNAIFSALTNEQDIILIDHFAHSSLIEGVKSSDAKFFPFLHNNTKHLEKLLKKHSKNKGRIFVVSESVFSTEGSIAPFKEIVDLCEIYNAIPVIDDSHGIGTIGKNLRGILEYSGIKDFKGIYTASLGKAIGSVGGMLCAPEKIINYVKLYMPHLIYSTSIAPAQLGAINKSISLIREHGKKYKEKLEHNTNLIKDSLLKAKFKITDSLSPINSIKGGSAKNTIKLAKEFFDVGILTTPFIEPSVSPNKGKLRIITGINVKEENLIKACNIIKKLGEKLN